MHEVVKRYEVEDEAVVIEFLKKVTTLDQVNMDIVNHSVLAMRFNEVIGMVSYEPFDEVGIIRYFVYDKTVTPDLIVNLFFELYAKAKGREIKQLVAMATNQYATHLFEMLGFCEHQQQLDLKLSDISDSENVSVLSIQLDV
ncbi:MAG TPA: hypothetical protein DCY20_10370 [Firmicutes bacterium]|nr:hypothetical protein [Bacillota bacterium]